MLPRETFFLPKFAIFPITFAQILTEARASVRLSVAAAVLEEVIGLRFLCASYFHLILHSYVFKV